MTKKVHGGKRKGAGRKSSEATKIIRVPVALIPAIKALIKEHKKKASDAYIDGDSAQVDLVQSIDDGLFDLDGAASRNKSLVEIKQEQERLLAEKAEHEGKPIVIEVMNSYSPRLVKYQVEVDGAMQRWTGRGRRPKWIEDYCDSGADLGAIRVNKGFKEVNGEVVRV